MNENDLIRRSDVIARIKGTGYADQIKENIRFAVDICPAVDAVEVVRCRECKFNGNFPEIPLCRYSNFERKGDGYCSMGQRRGDGDI